MRCSPLIQPLGAPGILVATLSDRLEPAMRFCLIDRITQLNEGESITASTTLTGHEEYLQDHFPKFPVMPGVLMLEAMYQASAWLIRKTEDFANPLVVLREARNVKYQDFVEPGQTLEVTARILKHDEHATSVQAQGEVAGKTAVSGRLILDRFSLAERIPAWANTDYYTRRELKSVFETLFPFPPTATASR